MHLVDRAIRWQAAVECANREAETLLSAIETCWVCIFGPMQTIIIDGETSLDSDASDAYFQLRGITKRTVAPGQHARVADRRAALLRDAVHKIESHLYDEGITVPFVRVLADCVFCTNSLWTFDGASPYNALLGRQPHLLPPPAALADDTLSEAPQVARHTHRLREVAVQTIVEYTARSRLKRARDAHTRVAGEQLELKVGDKVEYFRESTSKD
eukprot:6480788-Amphidinium_carterae.1